MSASPKKQRLDFGKNLPVFLLIFQGIVVNKIPYTNRKYVIQEIVVDGFVEITAKIGSKFILIKRRTIAVQSRQLTARRKPPRIRQIHVPGIKVGVVIGHIIGLGTDVSAVF